MGWNHWSSPPGRTGMLPPCGFQLGFFSFDFQKYHFFMSPYSATIKTFSSSLSLLHALARQLWSLLLASWVCNLVLKLFQAFVKLRIKTINRTAGLLLLCIQMLSFVPQDLIASQEILPCSEQCYVNPAPQFNVNWLVKGQWLDSTERGAGLEDQVEGEGLRRDQKKDTERAGGYQGRRWTTSTWPGGTATNKGHMAGRSVRILQNLPNGGL